MTISSTNSKAIGRGNGVTTAWAYPFKIPTIADVLVTVISAAGVSTQIPAAAYGISGVGTDAGGTVTYPLAGAPLAAGASIVIERVLAMTQPTNLENQGSFYPGVVEDALDRIVMLIQQMAGGVRDLDLAMLFPATDVNPVTTIPNQVARANKYLAFDASGNPIVLGGTASSPDVSAATVLAAGSTFARALSAWMNDWVNVKAWGAKGDGVTDDTAAIQAAINSLNPVNGGLVFFPDGIFIINGSIAMPAGGVGYTLRGSGKAASVIRTIHATADMLTAGATNAMICVEDLQFECLVARTAGSGIAFTGSQQVFLRRLRFIDTYNVVTLVNVGIGVIDDVQVAHGARNINRGIFMQGVIDMRLSKVVINGGNLNLNPVNAWFMIDSGCDTIVMDSCLSLCSSGTGRGLIISHSLTPASFAPEWIRLVNCNFEGSSGASPNANAQDAITISAGLNIYFTNGYVATSKNGIVATGGKDLRFTNFIIANCDRAGVTLTGVTSASLRGFTISDNSQEANNTYDGVTIDVSCSFVGIDDIYVGDMITGSARKMRIGINNASATTRVGMANFGNLGTAFANGNILGPMSGTFVPGWASSGVQPAIGNGTLTGEWFRDEMGIHVNIGLVIGGTTALGTGVYQWTVPIATSSVLNTIGQCEGVCAAAIFAGAVVMGGSAGFVRCIQNGAANFIGAAIPGAWAAGDSLNLSIHYQYRP